MKFAYQAEKLSAARSSLMLPHPQGEAQSIAHAFHECSLGLHELNEDQLDDNARSWVRRLKELMSTDGLRDPDGRGLWAVKAEDLGVDEKYELSRIVDELAHWFGRRFWTDS